MLIQNLDLKLVLCPTRNPEEKHIEIYNTIYACWNSVWTSAYSEANCHSKSEALKSDSFTRHDFVASIFYKDECIAFILFRYVDMSLAASREDSFFIHWNEDHLNSVLKIGRHILVCGNLGVPHRLRIKSLRSMLLGFSLKDLIGGIISQITLQSKAIATLATPRRDRDVHVSAYNWGATSIAENVSWGFGIQVDLISFNKNNLHKHQTHPLSALIDNLWLNKIVVEDKIFESFESFKNNQFKILQASDLIKAET